MNRGKHDGWAIGAALGLVYLSAHSRFYNFDGVACAIAVELGDLSRLAHGNHVAYGLVGRAFFRAWQLLGYEGPAIVALQALDSLLGAAAAGAFCAALRRLGLPRSLCAGAALCLGLSQAFWFWSLEAQVYPLALLFLALLLGEALAERPRPAIVGVLHGLAVLGHLAHVLLGPALLLALHRGADKPRRRETLLYGAGLAGTTAAGYAWAAVFAVKPESFEKLRVWLLGSAALNLEKKFAWHGKFYSWEGLRQWLMMDARIFSDYTALQGGWRALALALGIACLALTALGLRRALSGPRRHEGLVCIAWLVPYALFFLSWEPYTTVYRLSDLLPLWLLAAFALEGLRAAPALLGLAAALAAFNGPLQIRPKTLAENNPDYLEALWLGRSVPADSWVVVTGIGQVYAPYFGHVKPLNMHYWERRLPALGPRLDELRASGERVFITRDTLEAENWGGFLKAYGLAPHAREGAWELFELRRTESPAAGRRKG